MNSVLHNQTFTCGIFQKLTASYDDAVKCEICLLWIHGKCNDLTTKDCKHLKLINEVFFCKICTSDLFPFSALNDIEFNIMNSRKPSDIELLPSHDIMSKITSLGSLNISDIETNIPNPINSKCYYPSDFDKLAFACIIFTILFLLISR